MKVQRVVAFIRKLRFESSVISYGCQTQLLSLSGLLPFESSVISYGCQTNRKTVNSYGTFESSVISYGCQTLAFGS